MNFVGTLKKLTTEGVRVTEEGHARAGAVLDGAQGVLDIAREVHAEMSPDDDTPLVLTATEGVFIALEKFGIKLGN